MATTQNIYDMTDTWSDGGTTYDGIKMNVTDTASASDSKLLDLQVSGVSKFSVGKDGIVNSAQTTEDIGEQGYWTDSGSVGVINHVRDRMFVGAAAPNDGSQTIPALISNGADTWVTNSGLMGYFDTRSQFAAYSTHGTIAGAFATRTSDDDLTSNRNALAVASYALNDNNDAAQKKTVWNYYGHAVHLNTNNHYSTNVETDIINLSGTTVDNNPYSLHSVNTSGGYSLSAGGETAASIYASSSVTFNGQTKGDSDIAPISYGLVFIRNATAVQAEAGTWPGLYYECRFQKGIIFGSASLKRELDDETSAATAIEMAQGHQIVGRYGGGANAKNFIIRGDGDNADLQQRLIFGATALDVKGVKADLTTEVSLFRVNAVDITSTNSTNFLTVTPTQTGGGNIVLSAANSTDTDVDIRFVTKGAGVLRFGTRTAIAAETVTGYITIKDDTGTARKIAVVS